MERQEYDSLIPEAIFAATRAIMLIVIPKEILPEDMVIDGLL